MSSEPRSTEQLIHDFETTKPRSNYTASQKNGILKDTMQSKLGIQLHSISAWNENSFFSEGWKVTRNQERWILVWLGADIQQWQTVKLLHVSSFIETQCIYQVTVKQTITAATTNMTLRTISICAGVFQSFGAAKKSTDSLHADVNNVTMVFTAWYTTRQHLQWKTRNLTVPQKRETFRLLCQNQSSTTAVTAMMATTTTSIYDTCLRTTQVSWYSTSIIRRFVLHTA